MNEIKIFKIKKDWNSWVEAIAFNEKKHSIGIRFNDYNKDSDNLKREDGYLWFLLNIDEYRRIKQTIKDLFLLKKFSVNSTYKFDEDFF